MNRTFKVLGRDPETGRQKKKSVYTSEADYIRYQGEVIRRWKVFMNLDIETYEMIDGKWIRTGDNNG